MRERRSCFDQATLQRQGNAPYQEQQGIEADSIDAMIRVSLALARKPDRGCLLNRGSWFEPGGARLIMLSANARPSCSRGKRIDVRARNFCLGRLPPGRIGTAVPASSRQTHRNRWYGMAADGIRRIEITTEIASVVIPPYSAC